MTRISLYTRACAVRYKMINLKGYLSIRYKHIEGREVKMKPTFGGSTPFALASWRSKPQYGAALLNPMQGNHITE
jgi:hypothetical protein